MLAKIMHHCAFLIITFSSYTLCIQNGNTVSVDKLERKPIVSPEARQSSFYQSGFDNSGFYPSNNAASGFRFPDKYQINFNHPNELSSLGYRNPYSNNPEIANSVNQAANPYNLALNTGEHSASANNQNNYPYQHDVNAIASFGYRDSPNVNANDFYLSQQGPSLTPKQQLNDVNAYYPTPHRYQPILKKPTYAQAFGNYLYKGQPNYNRRPTPPPPRPRPESSFGPYQDGHLTGPYPYDDLTSTSSLTGPATYPPQYANQFGNFGGSSNGGGGGGIFGLKNPSNPLGSLLSSIGGPFADGNPLSMQIIRGLENIARNDDLQCVPKVLCQMLGSPTRRAQLPSFITSPALTRFIATLPSLSPVLIYARAALLGLSGGEYSCARTYNKCPQNEDDILFYLNNHRGGFFKFFSEPDSQPVEDGQNQYHYTTQQPPTESFQQQSQPSIFNFLTGLSPTSTTTTNTNQGNVNSFMSDAVTNGIGSLFGNIISGFLSGQTATRRNDDDDDDDNIDENPEKYSDLIESNSTTADPDKVEGRILNNKSNILAYVEPEHHNPISFPLESENDNYEAQQFQSEFRFPSSPHRDEQNDDNQNNVYRRGKKVNFIDSEDARPLYGTKMIFPDRTGTGNLRFDNDEYFRVGKILNRPVDYNRDSAMQQRYTTTTRRPTNYYTREQYTSNSGNLNRYASSNYPRQDYNNQNQANKEDTEGNVYVTNGQGVIEYYINAQGKKIYL